MWPPRLYYTTGWPTCEKCEIPVTLLSLGCCIMHGLLTISQNARGCAYKPRVGDHARIMSTARRSVTSHKFIRQRSSIPSTRSPDLNSPKTAHMHLLLDREFQIY